LIKDRDALLTFYDFPAKPPAIPGGAAIRELFFGESRGRPCSRFLRL